MADDFLQGISIGANIGQGRLEHQLRAQQLRSQEAERMVRERLVSQEIADLKRKADEDIQLKAEVQKAASRMAMDLLESDSIPMQPGEQGPPMANPNKLAPEAAFLKNFLPLARNPNEAAQMIASTALARQRGAQADFNLQRPEIEAAKLQSIEDRAAEAEAGRNTRAAEALKAQEERLSTRLEARMEEIKTKHELEKDELELRHTQALAVEKFKASARAAQAQGQVSREKWLDRHLNTTVEDIARTRAGAKLKPEERAASALKILSDAWDAEIGTKRSKEEPGAVSQTSTDLPTITSKADYDKLPKGAKFKGRDGKTYTKP